jgi:3-mercaptopyruvate sulfurtransferase SseA
MRLIFSAAAAIALAVVLLAACNSNDFKSKASANTNNLTTQTPSDGAPRITVAELKDLVDKNAVLIVDTRAADAYAGEHIKGAINIPAGTIVNRLNELPRDKMIVAYCS